MPPLDFPSSPDVGDIFVDWQWDGYKWIPAPGGGGGGAQTVVSDTPPASPVQGQLWWDDVGGQLYIWYEDGVSDQWVQANIAPPPLIGALPILVSDGGTGATDALTALDNLGGAPLDSPEFLGQPAGPTPPAADNSTRFATTAFVDAAIAAAVGSLPPAGVTSFNTRTGAVTFVQADITGAGGALSSQLAAYLPLTGGTLSGGLTINSSLGVTGVSTFGNNVNAQGNTVFAAGFTNNVATDFSVYQAGQVRVVQWGTNWYDGWDTINGTRIMVNGGATAMSMDAAGNTSITGTLTGPGANFSGSVNGGNGTIGGIALANNNINVPGTVFTTQLQATAATNGIGGVIFDGSQNVYSTGNNVSSCGLTTNGWAIVNSFNFNTLSDPRLKRDISSAPPGALDKVIAIPVRNFHWFNEAETLPLHAGWDATEVQAILGDAPAVTVGDDEDKTLGLSVAEMVAWLWEAVQELAAKVESLA